MDSYKVWLFVTSFSHLVRCSPELPVLWHVWVPRSLLPLNTTPWYGYSCSPLMDIWVVSTLGLLWTTLLKASMHVLLCEQTLSLPSSINLEAELLGPLVTLCLIIQGTTRLFSKAAVHFFSFPQVVWNFSTSSPIFVVFWLFDSSHPYGCDVVSHCGFALYPLDNHRCWTAVHVCSGHL